MASSEVMFIALVPNEYIVGAHALGTLNATSTVKNFPNPRIARESESVRRARVSDRVKWVGWFNGDRTEDSE